ncbi:MAG: YbaK/EbsC family protein [Candidatus Bipolaricaulota bacterium]
MDVEERIITLLEEEEVDYKRLTHEPVYTSKQASEVRGVPLNSGVKAMVLERDGDGLILALVPADHRVDLDAVGKSVECEVKLASPEEVLEVTGCEIGSVPPFGHKNPLETYLDPGVMDNEIVNFNAGKHDVSVELSARDLPRCVKSSGSSLTIKKIRK